MISHQLPLILIATASILLDRCLRYDLIADRLNSQVYLWLCLALYAYNPQTSSSYEDNGPLQLFHTWVHLVIFSNVLSISLSSKFNNTSTLFSSHSLGRRYRWEYLLPPATWLAMMASVCSYLRPTDDPSGGSPSVLLTGQVFVISIAVLWGIQWYFHQTRTVAHDIPGIPQSSHHYTNDDHAARVWCRTSSTSPDESIWYAWRVSETMQWIETVMDEAKDITPNHPSDDDDDERQLVLHVLAPHRISGGVLDTLTADQLVKLRVPYGAACRLGEAIQQRLVRVHPKPRASLALAPVDEVLPDRYPSDLVAAASRIPNSASALEQDTWLTLHDQEYNQPKPLSSLSTAKQEAPVASSTNLDPPSVPSMDPEQEERLAAMLKERYGLELPKIKTSQADPIAHPGTNPTMGIASASPTIPSATTPPSTATPMAQPGGFTTTPATSVQSLPQQSQSASVSSSVGGIGGVSPTLLENMPPHIREIAARRPDLVEQLFSQKRDNSTPQGQRQQPESNTMATIEEDDNVWEDDETTSLIQRKRRPQYKSTMP